MYIVGLKHGQRNLQIYSCGRLIFFLTQHVSEMNLKYLTVEKCCCQESQDCTAANLFHHSGLFGG